MLRTVAEVACRFLPLTRVAEADVALDVALERTPVIIHSNRTGGLVESDPWPVVGAEWREATSACWNEICTAS